MGNWWLGVVCGGCLIVLLLLVRGLDCRMCMRGSCRSGLKGHGTAGGMAPVFDCGISEIKELALAAATFGILGRLLWEWHW